MRQHKTELSWRVGNQMKERRKAITAKLRFPFPRSSQFFFQPVSLSLSCFCFAFTFQEKYFWDWGKRKKERKEEEQTLEDVMYYCCHSRRKLISSYRDNSQYVSKPWRFKHDITYHTHTPQLFHSLYSHSVWVRKKKWRNEGKLIIFFYHSIHYTIFLLPSSFLSYLFLHIVSLLRTI